MAENKSDDLVGKGIGLVVAAGALAFGVAAALMNNERSRQMREEFRGRIDDLGRRVDDLSAGARHRLDERRPDIEQGIQRGRQAAVVGLDKVKSAMEQGAEKAKVWVDQGADRAHDMVQRTAQKGGDAAKGGDDSAQELADGAKDKVSDAAGDSSGVQDTVYLAGENQESNPPGY